MPEDYKPRTRPLIPVGDTVADTVTHIMAALPTGMVYRAEDGSAVVLGESWIIAVESGGDIYEAGLTEWETGWTA